ncbi:MAG: prepilin peptidase [Dehalococcoidia bacterium]|nr:prepilin peptidase [Dehalococcoidia bacterium]
MGVAGGWGDAAGLDTGLAVGWVVVLVAFAVHDGRTRRIPNRTVYPAIALATLLAAVGPGRSTVDLLVGGAVGGAVFWLLALASRGGLGGGDVKLAVLVGLVVGASRLPVVLTVTALSGGVLALGVLALGQSRRALIPYGPCLVLGGIVALLGD